MEVAMTLIDHAARSIGLDRNPMRRRSDRVEGWVRLTTTVILLLVAPIIAGLAARAAYLSGTKAEAAERAQRHRIEAVLLQDATYSSSTGVVPTVLTLATWRTADDAVKTGWVRARIGATSGSSVRIWINDRGVPVDPPRDRDETIAVTVATAILVPVTAALLLGIAQLVLRACLDRHRMAQWQRAWQQIEPDWRGRTT
jgi:hypothetical protein